MRRTLLSFLLALLTLLPLSAAPLSIWGLGTRETFKIVYPFTDPDTGETGDVGGTAFCSPDSSIVVITAAHVVEGAPQEVPMIDSRNFKPHMGRVLKIDKKRDVAALMLMDDDKACELSGATWAREVPSPGQNVWAYGYGAMKETPLLVKGIISGSKGIEPAQRNGVPAQLGVLGGHSGSPVYNDQGQIVGMVDGFFKAYDIMDVIIPVEEIRKAIK
jgi:S1-C subfamily serine protease